MDVTHEMFSFEMASNTVTYNVLHSVVYRVAPKSKPLLL